MANYSVLQTRKLISSYGGVGSIIETIDGALIIKDFDKWRYFIQLGKEKIELEDNDILEDIRLLSRLKYYFPQLEKIVKIPANYSSFSSNSKPKLENNIINAEYFPKWMYCKKCNSFKHINDWYKGWGEVYDSKNIAEINASFSPPKCYKCYQKAKKDKKKNNRYNELEQVRFMLIAPNGNIRDIPWDKWTNLTREKDETGQEKIVFRDKCCDNQDLHYLRSDKFSDFSGVRIKCNNKSCKNFNKQVTLFGLLGLRLPDIDSYGKIKIMTDKEGNPIFDSTGNLQKIFFKPVIRTSNSVYYPLITNSLYIPHKEIKQSIKVSIKTLHKDACLPANKIKDIISQNHNINLSLEEINEILNPAEKDYISEINYRIKEYDYLANNAKSDNENLVFTRVTSNDHHNLGLLNLLKVNRLKVTSVQTGYSRQEPIDKDLFENSSMDEFIRVSRQSIKPKYTSTKGKNTTLLPGIESYGEGIFIEFDPKQISKWYSTQSKNLKFQERLNRLRENANNAEYRITEEKRKMLDNDSYFAKFIMLHTFSHLIIKELEFLVGYPATSISERLYIDNENMQGILIYTIAGAEGSFGGLISQAQDSRFIQIINSAVNRARDCASDPVCYNSEGQGLAGLNLAACYSCALLPETTCEEFNCYLDRALIVDEDFGFYRDLT